MGVLLLVIPLGGFACGGDDGGTDTPVTLSSITVSPATANVALGGTQQFTVTGTYSNKTTKAVTKGITWTSSSPGVVSISEAGLATAVASGTATITATVSKKSATATMTVGTAKTLSSVQVTPATATIGIGTTQSFMATAMYSDGSSEDVTTSATWASSDTGVATIAGGVASALSEGTTTISAAYEGQSGSAVLVVTGAQVVGLTVAPATVDVAAGDTQQFTATLEFDDNTTQVVTNQVTWTSSDTAIATVAASGLATAVAVGDATISAAFQGQTGTATMTVIDAYVTSVVVDPPTATGVVGGGNVDFTATAIYSDGSNEDVTDQATWTSSDDAIATVDAGAATPVAEGTATITAEFGGESGSATLAVTEDVVLDSIAVTPATASIAAGTTQQFIATATYSDNSTANVTSSVSWTTSAPSIATVSALGLATGVAAGDATITAALNNVQGTAALTVTDATLQSIQVSPASATIPAGGSQQFAATGLYSNNTTQVLTSVVSWTSSATSIATIDAAGLASAVANGTTNITAAYQGVTSNTATLTVSGVVLQSVSVSCTPASIAAGTNSQCTATATYSDNSTQNVTSAATWTTSASGVATVNQLGQVHGVAAGTATITAAYQGQSNTATVTVTAALLQSIQVTPIAPSIVLGNTQQFAAAGVYSDSTTQDITDLVTWTSATPATATISNAAGSHGLATSIAVGTTNITAALGGITSNTAALTVTNALLTSIDVLPTNTSVPVGYTQQFTARGHYSDNTVADLTNNSSLSFSSGTTTVATISNAAGTKGLATAVAAGTSTITATLGTVSGTTTMTVSTAVLSSIQVTAATSTTLVGTTVPFTATGVFSDSSTLDITTSCTWTVIPPTPGVTVGSATGIVTVTGTATPALYTIRATKTPIVGSATLTVKTADTLQSIEVRFRLSFGDFYNQPYWSYWVMPTSSTLQAVAYGTYSDGINPPFTQPITSDVTWGTNNSHASASNAAATKGLITSSADPCPAGFCSVVVTATYQGITANNTIWVVDPNYCPEDPNLLVFGSTPLYKGQQDQAAAWVAFTGPCAGGYYWEVTEEPGTAWSSDNLAVATVNSTGVVTASNNPPNPPTARITATYTKTGYTGTGYYDLAVSQACIQSITVSPVDPTVPAGVFLPLHVTANLSDGSQEVFDYMNPAPVGTLGYTVDAAVLNDLGDGIIQGIGLGTGDVDVTVTNFACDSANPPTATTSVTVSNAQLTGISVAPATVTLQAGADTQLTATGTFNDGSQHDVTLNMNWATNNGAVATVNQGRVNALAQGSAIVTASAGAFSDASAITVSGCELLGINVTLASSFSCPIVTAYPVGVNVPLVAWGDYGTCDVPRNITAQVSWSSDLGAIQVSQNGYARTNASTGGSLATITASLGGIQGTYTLGAETSTLSNTLTVLSAGFSVPNGATYQFKAQGAFSGGLNCDLVGNVVNWNATPSTLLTIDANGLATGANNGSGAASVTATYAPDNTKTGTVAGTVGGLCIKGFELNPDTATIQDGQVATFTARWIRSDNSTTPVTSSVTWSIPAQAPANTLLDSGAGGTAGTWTFTGNGVGTATVRGSASTVTCSSGGASVALNDTAAVTVTAATLASIVVHCDQNVVSNLLPVGVHGSCWAEGIDTAGDSMGDISESVMWPAVSSAVNVSNTAGTKGDVTGVSAGSAIVRAESGSIYDEQVLTILPDSEFVNVVATPGTVTLPLNYGQAYTATAEYNHGGSVYFNVTDVGAWSCCEGTGATCTAATNCTVNGNTMTPTSGTPATVYPRVTYKGDRGTSTMTIVTSVLSSISIDRIDTPQSGNPTQLVLGEEAEFRAMGVFGASTPVDITEAVNWSAATGGYFTVDNTAGSKGQVKAIAATSGTVNLIASNVSPAIQGTLGLTVSSKCITGLDLTSSTASAPTGLNVRFTATATYSDGSSGDVTSSVSWQSDNAANAFGLPQPIHCGSATCYYSQALTPGQGAVVSASITGCGGTPTADSVLVSVNAATLTSVVVSPGEVDLPQGGKTRLTATANYSNSTSFDVTNDPNTAWSVLPSGIVSVVSTNVAGSDPAGTVATSAASGSASVVAAFHGAQDFSTVTVVDAVLSSIVVYGLDMRPMGGDCADFDALPPAVGAPWTGYWMSSGYQLPVNGYKSHVRVQGLFTDGVYRDVTSTASWTSSDTGVATVTGGVVQSGATSGTTTITATVGTHTDTLTLVTSASALSAVNVIDNDGVTTVPIGNTNRFHVIGTFGATSFCVDESATWTTANTAIATVSNVDGSRGIVTGVGQGGTTVTATIGTLSDTEAVGVTAAVLASIAVMPATVSLTFGETAQLVAMGTYSDGTTSNITNNASTVWSNTGLSGTVNGTGLFSANNVAGTAMVDACVDPDANPATPNDICASNGTVDQRSTVTVSAP